MRGRCGGDAGEMRGRCRGDAGEMQGRCRGDLCEICARSVRDPCEIQGRSREICARSHLGLVVALEHAVDLLDLGRYRGDTGEI